jgi:hypothetical protein
MKMTFSQIKAEWEYAYNERLGMMIEDRAATPEQEREARLCADRHVQELDYIQKSKT